MADGPIPQGMAGAAANPDTDPETLRQIAYHYPELRATVAENPAAYPGLLEWLGALGEPAVTDALSRRAGAGAGSSGAGAADDAAAGPADVTPEATTVMPPVTTPQPGSAPVYYPASSQAGTDATTNLSTNPDTEPTQTWPTTGGAAPNAGRTTPSAASSPASGTPVWTSPTAGAAGAGAQGAGAFAASGTPGQAPNTADQTPPKKSRSLTITLVILAIVALVLAGLVVAIFSGAFSSKPSASGSPTPTTAAPTATATTASPSSSPSPSSASPSASPSASTVKYPAPSDAQKVSGFTAPSGNISCDLGGDSVSCEIKEQNWSADGFQTCGDQSATIVGSAGGAALGCGTSVSGGGTLAYGAFAASGNVACQSTQDGVSCWNTVTGNGFALAKGGWQTGSSGRIGPESFTW